MISTAWAQALFTPVKDLPDLLQKLSSAKANHKPVLLEFWASWCPSCQLLDDKIFSNPAVQRNLRSVESIRINLTDKLESQMQIADYFNVYGTPTFIMFDHNGKEANSGRFNNGISVEEFTNAIQTL